jgi:hypothetical protein
MALIATGVMHKSGDRIQAAIRAPPSGPMKRSTTAHRKSGTFGSLGIG